MENHLFTKLFNNVGGLEDFSTEILAGVLRSNQTLLDSFVNKVLGIKGHNFKIETQRSYQNVTINLVFSNEKTLCFLENTIQAVVAEQLDHLKKCESILLAEQDNYKNLHLRYCSKYYGTQAITGIDFAQLRWADISAFFESCSENPLISAFLDFIKDNNMKGITALKTDDLIAISRLNDTLYKMDECLDSVAAEFTMLFGYPTQGAPQEKIERLKRLVELNSYRMMKQDILLGGGGWSEITICFNYEKTTNAQSNLAVWYWCDKTHHQYEQLKQALKQNKRLFSIHPGFIFEDRTIGLRIILQKPLMDFEAESNQLQAIHTWFIQSLTIFRQFADKTPELNWNIPQ